MKYIPFYNKSKDVAYVFGPNNGIEASNVMKEEYLIEPFFQQKDDLHIVFSGCSITAACGLDYLSQSWSKLLYNKIKEESKIGSYYNISISGASIPEIILNVFEHINKYGSPDYIFLLLPNISRNCVFMRCDDNFQKQVMQNFTWQMYNLLDSFCNSNQIKLISMTWDSFVDGVNNFFVDDNENDKILNTENILRDFNTFYLYNKKDFGTMLYDECINSNNFNLIGNDDSHPNFQFHNVYYKLFYDIYISLQEKQY